MIDPDGRVCVLSDADALSAGSMAVKPGLHPDVPDTDTTGVDDALDHMTFEDGVGSVMRRVKRVARFVRWTMKSALGIRRRVLVEMDWRLGDEIMALPVYGAMRRAWPDADIAVLTHYPELFDGLEGVRPVARLGADSSTGPRSSGRLSTGDGAFAPDRYIYLRDASRTVYRAAHYARLAGVSTPKESPRVALADWDAPLIRELPGDRASRVAIAAGTTWTTKQWAPDNWRALADRLGGSGYALVELGQGHQPVTGAYSLVDRTSIRDAARVLRACRLLVSGDSGLMHLAIAVGTPVVGLFGPTDPSVLIRDEPLLNALTNGRPCQGCWNISLAMNEPGVCPLSVPDCLETISVDRVMDAVHDVAPLGS